jgi:hypothetical protein
MDDCQCGYITKLKKEGKKHLPTSPGMLKLALKAKLHLFPRTLSMPN